jgi:hypothetical protein
VKGIEEAGDRGAPLVGRVAVQVVLGLGQVDDLHPLTALGHRARVGGRELAAAGPHDEHRTRDPLLLRPRRLPGRLAQGPRHHLGVQPRPPAAVAMLRAIGPRLGAG